MNVEPKSKMKTSWLIYFVPTFRCLTLFFHRYLQSQKDDYNDGKTDLSPPDNLMELAGNKYKSLVEEDMWQATTASDKEIIALRAQIASLKSPTNPGKKEKGPEKKKKFEKKKESTSYTWKTVAPKTSDPIKKTVGEKTYHWCLKHSAWTLHTPEQCNKVIDTTEATPTPWLNSSNCRQL